LGVAANPLRAPSVKKQPRRVRQPKLLNETEAALRWLRPAGKLLPDDTYESLVLLLASHGVHASTATMNRALARIRKNPDPLK
jgi:hypothetical protein